MRKKGGIAAILRTGQFPGTVVRGTTKGNHANIHVEAKYAAPNLSYDMMSAKQREREDAKVWKVKAKAARETQHARRGTRRADDEIRPSGHIPYGIYTAMRRKYGKKYWSENPREKLKKHGLAFDN